jgi:hypothetical protein
MNIQGTQRRLIAILTGIVLATAATLALTGAFSWADDVNSASQSQTTTTSSPAEAGPDLGVLRSGAASMADVPGKISSVLNQIPATEGGHDKGVIERLGIEPGGSRLSEVVVAEVSERICVFAEGTEYQGAAVGSCFSAAEVEAGEGFVAVQGMPSGLARVIGVAPDGVAHVSIDSGEEGQADAVVNVSANVYQADLRTAPTVASGMNADGSVAFKTTMPLSIGDR